MIEKGFVYLHKRIIDHPIFKNAEHYKLFSWMILNAAWGNFTTIVDGKTYRLQKGQLVTSRKELSELMGLTPRCINKYLVLFVKKFDVIQIVKDGQKYIIRVKNYERYQRK